MLQQDERNFSCTKRTLQTVDKFDLSSSWYINILPLISAVIFREAQVYHQTNILNMHHTDLRSMPPSREALRHSGGDSLLFTSAIVTLYFEVELSSESRPGTEQNRSVGFTTHVPPAHRDRKLVTASCVKKERQYKRLVDYIFILFKYKLKCHVKLYNMSSQR